MNFPHAFTYIFEDKHWVSKIVLLFVFGVLSLIPVLGLLALAVSLGYMAQIASNVRNGLPLPMPSWTDYDVKFNIGSHILLAMITYNLPIIFIGACVFTLVSGLGGSFLATTTGFVALCCTLPALIIYTVIVWPMLAIGIVEYMDVGEAAAMYRPTHLFDVLRANNVPVLQWAMAATLINLLTIFIGIIPCIGQLIILGFALPIQGHLLGQFARELGATNIPRPRKQHA